MRSFLLSSVRLALVAISACLTARAAVIPTAKDIVDNHYTYQLGWGGMVPESAGKRAKVPGTLFGDAAGWSNLAIGDDPANGVRALNVTQGAASAWLEYKFDFSRAGRRVSRMTIRDILRMEPEPGNWAVLSVLWRASEREAWRELRSLNGTRFAVLEARAIEVDLPAPSATIYYRVEFSSEKPVTYPWGRGRWNFLKEADAADTCFKITFDLATPNQGKATVAKTAAGDPSLATKVASPWGIGSHPMRPQEWDNMDVLIDRVRGSGMTWLREDFPLARILTKNGEWDFTRHDLMVDRFSREGIHTLGILHAFSHELRKVGLSDIAPIHQHPEAWRRYVRAVVGHFHGRVKSWVVWNEQDGGFWGTNPNAAEYVPLLKIAYEEIKAIDPSATVVTGGLEYWNSGYLKSMYLAGAKGYFDVVGIHRYGPGPDGSATVERTMREFRALMAEHGQADVPVWILESGYSTFRSPLLDQQPLFMEKTLRYALKRIGRPAAEGPLVAGLAIPARERHPDEVDVTRGWLPGTTLQRVTLDRLKALDPAACPVLIVDSGLHIDEPMLEPMQAYVKRGGLLLLSGHPPLYVLHSQDDRGIWQRKESPSTTYPLFRMGFAASWTQKGVPEHTDKVAVSASALAGGVPPVKGIYVNRFFTGKNMAPGDTYEPILSALDARGEPIADAVALYTYGDWKGAVLASTPKLAAGWTEEQQAMYLPRIYLSYLASRAGVEKIFIYDLHDDGQLRGEPEHNFGLNRWDWSPKPALGAYREMTAALGVAPVFVTRLAVGNASHWALVFRRAEDKRLVLAAWSAESDGAFAVTGSGADWAVEGTSVRYLALDAGVNTEALNIRDEASGAPAKN